MHINLAPTRGIVQSGSIVTVVISRRRSNVQNPHRRGRRRLYRTRARGRDPVEPDVHAVGDRRSFAGRRRDRREGRRAALPLARRTVREGPPRWRRARDAEPVACRARAEVHRGRRADAAGKTGRADRRGSRDAREGSRAHRRENPDRPSSRSQPDHGAREATDRRRAARQARRGDGQRRVLQARPLFRRCPVAQGTGRRARSCST